MNDSAKTFTLIGIVVSVLLLLYQLPALSVGDLELRHVNLLSSLLPEQEEENIDVLPVPQKPKALVANRADGKKITFKETWSKGIQPITDYSEGNAGGMEHFYQQLANIKALTRPVRIAYYGDSYIEGDILTCDLRELFQHTYGGMGVGWVDCGSSILSSRRSIRQQSAGIVEFMAAKKPFNSSRQGISERYFIPEEGAHVKTSGTRFYPQSSKWTHTTLFFSSPSSLTVKATLSKGTSSTQTFEGSTSVQTFALKDTTTSVAYTFSNVGAGTTLYGMALESERGVILDNFSMRGSPGLTLADIPLSTLRAFNNLRPYDLIVLHFGLNVAVRGNKLVVMRGYTNKMKRVVANLRTAFPQASILIMSVPDRDRRTADGIETLPEVKQLVALQEQLAADTRVAFCNFFEAMGGAGSVAALVDRKMANKDYTHLSFGGGKALAKKIFPSFTEGVKNYKRRKALEK